MTESFTPNDLVKYIYQDMAEAEAKRFEEALSSNPVLMQDYMELLSAVDVLDNLFIAPQEDVVNEIKNNCQSATGLEKV
jgi:hypothetical protein